MNIAYDISLIGLGFRSAKCRTGIYRVVENIFRQLMEMEQINVLPLSLREDQTLASQDYLDAHLSSLTQLHSLIEINELQITKQKLS